MKYSILGGELIFDEVDVELFADNILITEGGKLQVSCLNWKKKLKAFT